MDDYISKPFKLESLLEAIDGLPARATGTGKDGGNTPTPAPPAVEVKRREGKPPADPAPASESERAEGRPEREERGPKAAERGPEREVFDKERALAQCRGRAHLFVKVVGVFLDDYPGVMAKIDAAIADGDSDRVRRTAHRLKGGTGTVAASGAWESAQRLELIGSQGNLDKGREVFAELEQEMDRLAPALREFRAETEAISR